ncbi:MAG TPA: DUF2695 domain-containing protein [Nocardioidaceae bacterium]|nr:DUF2695 domain-containing protein [Nocardioidaceae bacterium]
MDPLVADAEQELRVLSTALTDPHASECLLCYVYRMLEYGCTGLRWAGRYRDLRAPRATALERRLGRTGGYCDCEIFLNGYELAPELWVPSEEYVEDSVTYQTDPSYPDPIPACRGVRRGSTQSCRLWIRQRRR